MFFCHSAKKWIRPNLQLPGPIQTTDMLKKQHADSNMNILIHNIDSIKLQQLNGFYQIVRWMHISSAYH